MTNTTTNTVAEAIWDAHGQIDKDDCLPLAQAAIEAYEKASVREMTVEEVAQVIFAGLRSAVPLTYQKQACDTAAYTIAKLGTIRIVGGGDGKF